MLELLTYPPVLRGLILLIISGFTFPIGGVFILRMNVLPLRYLLMHGVLLGGAIGLALGFNESVTIFVTNLLLVLLLNRSSKALNAGYGQLAMFFMVATVAAASIVMARFHVPAKDTLSLLWGSLYSAGILAVYISAAAGLFLVLFTVIFFRQLTAVFFDHEVASSLGIRVNLFELAVMLTTALVVAVAMKLMGALLLDAQIILPVVIAGFLSSGLKQTILLSSLLGGLFSVVGFFISLCFDIPVSAGTAVPAAVMFIAVILIKRGIKFEKKL